MLKNFSGMCLKTRLVFNSVQILYFSHDNVRVFDQAFMGVKTTTIDIRPVHIFHGILRFFQANTVDRTSHTSYDVREFHNRDLNVPAGNF
jgi:hypothetical protein